MPQANIPPAIGKHTHTNTADKKDEPRSLKDEHLGLSFILCPNKPIQLVILHKQSSGHQLEDIDSLSAGQIRKDPGKLDGSLGNIAQFTRRAEQNTE